MVEFRSHFDVDNRGGRSIVNPSVANTDAWENKGVITNENYDVAVMDGDSVRFWIEARDIAGHATQDSVLVPC